MLNGPAGDQGMGRPASATEQFRRARDQLLASYGDCATARAGFSWPRPRCFNWALDWFDVVAAGNDRPGLRLAGDDNAPREVSFDALRRESNQLANHLRRAGLRRGDRVLLMLGNIPELWQTMLAAMKLGCVIVPTTTLMSTGDLRQRLARGGIRAVVTQPDLTNRFDGLLESRTGFLSAGVSRSGWRALSDASGESDEFEPEGRTEAADPLLLYFTSGTTAQPKLVLHTHASYPIGHLSTMHWLGVRPGDVHLNLSSAGWAKHAWSLFFAPWSAEATVLALQSARFDPTHLLEELVRSRVTSFCAPPTVWRALIQQPLNNYAVCLREALSAGEPLNPEIISQVHAAWGLTVRDGFGQTETTLLVGNFPGASVVPGAMGKAAPGYALRVVDADGRDANEGELCVELQDAPVGVMPCYADDPERTTDVMRDGLYHTGDVVTVAGDGTLTYVGRNDDVFKSSDYRISPFELESVLIEHPAVVEAAVVPSQDARRLAVPKAFIVLAPGYLGDRDTAQSILEYVRMKLSPFKRIRRIEFRDLPKTVSGKIRRVELRSLEATRDPAERRPTEYWEEDFAGTVR